MIAALESQQDCKVGDEATSGISATEENRSKEPSPTKELQFINLARKLDP